MMRMRGTGNQHRLNLTRWIPGLCAMYIIVQYLHPYRLGIETLNQPAIL